MELIIDEKGRKVINVPFLKLERNPEWFGEKSMPYLEPNEEFVLPKDEIVAEEKETITNADMYLCTEEDENN